MSKNIKMQFQNMKKIYISPSTKIIEAMKLLAKTRSKCLIVVGEGNYFYGTLNDGDLRRGILKGLKEEESIQTIYQKKPIVINDNQVSLTLAKNLMRKNLLSILPVINQKRKIIKYFTWDELFEEKILSNDLKDIDFIIMAGGKGTRLAPYTSVLPKPLMPINDIPIIQHIIDKFHSFGGVNFYISVNYKSLLLKSFFNELKPLYNVKFLEEDKPLGTVGGLYIHRKKFTHNDLIVCNCDVLINTNFSEIYKFHKKKKSDVTIVTSIKNYEIPYGICYADQKGRLKKIVEKPKSKLLVNTGLYIINPKILNLIPKNKFFHMTKLIELAKKRKYIVTVYPIEDNEWVDMGQLSSFTNNVDL